MDRQLTEEEIEAVFQLTGDTLLSNYFSLFLGNVVYFYPLKLVEFKALTQVCSETCVLTRF